VKTAAEHVSASESGKEGGLPLSLRKQLLWMVLIALAIRVAVIPLVLSDQIDPARDHWNFGCETGRLARSLASGNGFASPLFGDTGPSAWMTPLYPLLLSAVFKVLGIYSTASAWCILALNGLFSALTTVPIVLTAGMSFGWRTARLAGWLWVFFPYAIYLSAGLIWGHTLDALLMATAVWLTFRLRTENTWGLWSFYGVVWGLSALASPVLLAALPGLLAWLVAEKRRNLVLWLARAAAASLILTVVVSPWFIRNAVTLHRFIPFRDNFWLVFWQGNTGDTSDLYPDWANPPHSPAEMAELQRVGELAYMEEKHQQALSFLRAHQGFFMWLTVRRVGFTWTGFWSLSHPYVDNEPFQIPNTLFCTILTIGMLAGLKLAWKQNARMAFPYAWVLFAVPFVYYITHAGVEYRHPIDPVLVCLIAFACSEWRARRRGASIPGGEEASRVVVETTA